MRQFWDISQRVDGKTRPFPGDTPLGIHWDARTERGDVANVSTLQLSPHLGTHIDAPLHLFSTGHDVSELSLEALLGPCEVWDLSLSAATRVITASSLTPFPLSPRVLIKTQSEPTNGWRPQYRPLGVEAVLYLANNGVRLIGVDTPGVDPSDSMTLDAHHFALSNGMILLENLDLSRVSSGAYTLAALPLSIVGLEASPVRAILYKEK